MSCEYHIFNLCRCVFLTSKTHMQKAAMRCRRFQCNLCGMVCECPPEYFCATDGQGKRLDHHQRPELSQGSVEFVAPQEYMVQPHGFCPLQQKRRTFFAWTCQKLTRGLPRTAYQCGIAVEFDKSPNGCTSRHHDYSPYLISDVAL